MRLHPPYWNFVNNTHARNKQYHHGNFVLVEIAFCVHCKRQ